MIMKRFILFVALCSICMLVHATPEIVIQAKQCDPDIAAYIQESLQKQLRVSSAYTITFVLVQDEDKLSVSYSDKNETMRGNSRTDNVWTDLDPLIQRIVTDIHGKLPLPATTSQTQTNVISPAQSSYQPQYTGATTTPVYNNTYSTTSNNQTTKRATTGEEYLYRELFSSSLPPQVSLDDVNRGSAQIGSLLVFPDGTRGIIFYLVGTHGLVVSLDETKAKWENVRNSSNCTNILHLVDDRDYPRGCVMGLGEQQTDAILSQLGNMRAPAADWCVSHGAGWYLPSAGEMWQLITIANEEKGALGKISLMCEIYGGVAFAKGWYWTSSEQNYEEAYNISSGGSTASEDKDENNRVRAIRRF